MDQPKNGKEISKFRKALPQILAIGVKNILLFGFGMTLGFPTILIPKLSGEDANEAIVIDQETTSWLGSITYLIVPVGCLFSGAITQPFGRRRAMQFVNVPFFAAWLLFYFSTETWHLLLALCLTGAAGGLLEAPTITYLSEVTTPDLRGILTSSTTVSVIGGTLFIIVMGSVFHWKTVALFSCISPIVSVILLFFVPESPHWLISKNRFEDAQRSIAWLRGWIPVENVKSELEDLSHQINQTRQSHTNTEKSVACKTTKFRETAALYTRKDFLWPFALVLLVFFLANCSGTTTLLTYAVSIFETLGSSGINKYYATIILSLAQVIGCILSSSLVHFTGKRKVNFFSLIGCGICFAVVAIYAYQIDARYLVNSHQANLSQPENSWIPLTFLIGSALFAAVGIRILPWMLVGEVFHHQIRASASGFACGLSYVMGFCANKTFFTFIDFLTLPGTFMFYSALCFIGFVLLYFWLPETERKTLFEVAQHFAGNVKLSNKIKMKTLKNKNGEEINEGFQDSNTNDCYISVRL